MRNTTASASGRGAKSFLLRWEHIIPWSSLLKVIEPFYPVAGRGRHPYPLETMLRIHFLQNWYALSDPAMEEALYETTPLRVFAKLSLNAAIPDETTILNFRRLLEENELAPEILGRVNAYLVRKGLLLKRGSMVDATIIAAPSSTKNAEGGTRPGDAPNEERESVALWDESAYWSRCRFGLGAYGDDDGGQRGRRGSGG